MAFQVVLLMTNWSESSEEIFLRILFLRALRILSCILQLTIALPPNRSVWGDQSHSQLSFEVFFLTLEIGGENLEGITRILLLQNVM